MHHQHILLLRDQLTQAMEFLLHQLILKTRMDHPLAEADIHHRPQLLQSNNHTEFLLSHIMYIQTMAIMDSLTSLLNLSQVIIKKYLQLLKA